MVIAEHSSYFLLASFDREDRYPDVSRFEDRNQKYRISAQLKSLYLQSYRQNRSFV